MVTKEILIQYADLRKEVEETKEKISNLEKQIEKIEKDGSVKDKVFGGEGGLQPFTIEGFPYPEYSRKKMLLHTRKAILSELEIELLESVNEAEKFIASITDSHMRRIVNLRVIEGLSWNKVADKMGGNNNEDSVRKAFDRFVS